jgi:hypothetical protein
MQSSTPIFALIIGNNEYTTYMKSLLYAVADADAIEDFLQKRMALLPSNTISLRNATRQQILEGFLDLEGITDGSKDPCIVIFYAGHGAQGRPPKQWKEYVTGYNVIELLCPSDIGCEGKDGKVVEGIPDKWVGDLLKGLASKRGNNIVSSHQFTSLWVRRRGADMVDRY